MKSSKSTARLIHASSVFHLDQLDNMLEIREVQLQDLMIRPGELTLEVTQHVIHQSIALHHVIYPSLGIYAIIFMKTWAFAVSDQSAQLGEAEITARALEQW